MNFICYANIKVKRCLKTKQHARKYNLHVLIISADIDRYYQVLSKSQKQPLELINSKNTQEREVFGSAWLDIVVRIENRSLHKDHIIYLFLTAKLFVFSLE